MCSRAFSLCAAATFYASATLSAPPPKAPFIEQLSCYPQEKLYVHTDKEHYIAGDTVWLRAHCVDAATLTPACDSRHLYVELHDGSGALVRRIKILRRDGIYAGYLPLPDDAAGDYALCAYTLFMRNLPEGYLFRKPLRVGGLRDAGKSPREERRRKRFPEGGYLVNGHPCRVGFKAPGDDGRPRFSEGWLLDDKGHFVDSLHTRHAGIGSGRYVAEFPDREGRLHRFELPEAEDYTFVLCVDPTDSTFVVSIRSGRNWLPRGLRLVVHRCGTQCYNKAWDPLVLTLTFRREELPDGLFTIAPSEVEAFVAALPVERFFGIGAVTAERMHRLGIHTGADLRQWDEAALVQRFGKAGHAYYGYARGVDEREVEPNRVRKSVYPSSYSF